MEYSTSIQSDIDTEWDIFLKNQCNGIDDTANNYDFDSNLQTHPKTEDMLKDRDKIVNSIPECEDLYISTKTKVLYLNVPVDIYKVFWDIPVVEYWKQTEGVLKKQIKIINNTLEEYECYKKQLINIPFYTENIIKQIDNPSARKIKYKDERKLTVGLSKKEILTHRLKKKNAFYNCFALVVRFFQNKVFKEVHIKVFNTGKMEIPGILNKEMLELVQLKITEILQPHINSKLTYKDIGSEDNVLINSNFNCGFNIDRETLYSIIKSNKYGIEAAYDPCSYPGIKCKYYFNNNLDCDKTIQTGCIDTTDQCMKRSELDGNKKYTEISFMIFRTGSCLIVGNCSEKTLLFVFDFIKKVLQSEYKTICTHHPEQITKVKKKKIRKKIVQMTNEYYKSKVFPNNILM